MDPTSENTSSLDRSEAELAAAIDRMIDARQAGQGVDRNQFLNDFPQLHSALDALDKLCQDPVASLAPPAEPKPASLPAQIGSYRIECEVGSGGFGVVYKAFDTVLKRHVALKVLHPGKLNQTETIDRFFREARATGRLQHPGIVQLCDYSREGPPYYLATQFIDGVDLRTWCQSHKASLTLAADLIARVAETVDEAHAPRRLPPRPEAREYSRR